MAKVARSHAYGRRSARQGVQPKLGLGNRRSVGLPGRGQNTVEFTGQPPRWLENRHVPLDVSSVRPSAPNGLFDGLIWPKAGW